MIGPHYQRLAQLERKMTGKQMLERIQSKTDNPLQQIIEKLKKQFNQYDTVYNDDLMHQQISSVDRLLSFDSKLGPILSTLEKENNLLRREVQVFESQLSNTVGICEQLVDENSQQKKIIQQKNSDILKIIQTIAYNQSQKCNQLEDKIEILQHQNSILIQHLEEVKKAHHENIVKFQEKDQEIISWRNKWEECKKNLNEVIMREHDLSRKLSLAEHNLYEETEKLYECQKKVQALEFENSEMSSELLLIKQDIKESNIEIIKARLQEQYKEIVQEHKNLKKQLIEMKRQSDKYKSDKNTAHDELRDLESKFSRMLKDFQRSASLLQEQKQRNATMVSTLNKIQEKLQIIKEQNVKLLAENEAMKSTWEHKESMLEEKIEFLNRQIYEKSQETENKLKEIRYKTQQLLDAKDMELQSLSDTNNELRRQLGHF